MKRNCLFSRIMILALVLTIVTSLLCVPAFAASEEILESDIVSDEVTAKGGVVSRGLADFQFLVGNFFDGGELKPFEQFSGSGQYLADDALGDLNGNNAVWRWQWRATATSNTVLKITAKEDMCFTIKQGDPIRDEQWATHSTYAYVTENAQGDRLTVHKMPVKATMTNDYIQAEFHLAKGDTLYVVYYVHTGDDSSNATSHYMPTFVMDTAAYNASKRTDYSVITDLRDAKAEKSEALSAKLTELLGDSNVYSVNNADKLSMIVDAAISEIQKASAVDEVTALYDTAMADISEIKTIAEENQVLVDFRQQAKEELAACASEENYTSANWKIITDRIAKANEDIDAATNSAGVSQILAYAKADIRKVEQKSAADYLPLIIAIAAGAVVVSAVVVVIVVAKKKKN